MADVVKDAAGRLLVPGLPVRLAGSPDDWGVVERITEFDLGAPVRLVVRFRDGEVDEFVLHNLGARQMEHGPWECDDVVRIGPDAPETVSVLWCPMCGRDDRADMLRRRHKPPIQFQGLRAPGGVCTGVPVRVSYSSPVVTVRPEVA